MSLHVADVAITCWSDIRATFGLVVNGSGDPDVCPRRGFVHDCIEHVDHVFGGDVAAQRGREVVTGENRLAFISCDILLRPSPFSTGQVCYQVAMEGDLAA
ncbi:unnamed protein product [Cylicocyclus nassatus]|uniref:Uncharacterized protein n=1 Tax=Cylicocyclus nassatus TaxID=53992 RepID=A0AA36MEZ3_CYLNA|nr:unnamed protein product [Cylicocyclus nassatus]